MRDYAVLINALKAMSNTNSCFYCQGEPLVCEANGCTLSNAADAIEELLDELTTIRKQLPHWFSIETNIFDQEEIHPNCTVQILKNSVTGEVSIGWWPNKEDDNDKTVCE